MVCTHPEPVLPAQCVLPRVQSGQPCPIPGPSGLMHESTCRESRGVLLWSMPVALMEVSPQPLASREKAAVEFCPPHQLLVSSQGFFISLASTCSDVVARPDHGFQGQD